MCVFTRSKINKFVAVISLLLAISILSVGCGLQAKSQRSALISPRDSLRTLLYTYGSLESLGIIPRALSVPVTSGETPYGFLVAVEDASIAVLIGFNGFTAQEISQSADQIIPFATSLLEESLGGSVISFSPVQLNNIGLADGQAVHNLVLNNLLNGMDLYMRCYVSKVDGPQGPNIRMDFYGWANELLEPGQFLIRLEFQESVFNQLLQLS